MREANIVVFGDVHGDWQTFRDHCEFDPPALAVFVGDFDLERPLEQELAQYLEEDGRVLWVPGNHDTDTPERHDNLFGSSLAGCNLSGRVVQACDVRFAGLGGIFRSDIWLPGTTPVFETRAEFLATYPEDRWRGGLPLMHRSTIFPEDIERLAAQRADVLVCHEPPSSHMHGWPAIDDLAAAMGVHTIVHGHTHDRYEATLSSGIRVVGIENGGYWSALGLARRGANWLSVPPLQRPAP